MNQVNCHYVFLKHRFFTFKGSLIFFGRILEIHLACVLRETSCEFVKTNAAISDSFTHEAVNPKVTLIA